MTPRRAYEAFAKVPGYNGRDQSQERSRTGRVGLDDLLAIVSHHTCRTVTVSVGPWGLTDIPAKQVVQHLKEPYFQERCRRMLEKARAEKPGCLIEVSLSVSKIDRVKHEAYGLLLHSVLVDVGDDRAYYLD